MNSTSALTTETEDILDDAGPIHRNRRLARTDDPAQVLVIGPAWVGDMVMAQVLFQVMRRRWPQVQIDLLAPPASAPLGERMAEIRQVHILDIPHKKLQLKLRRIWGRRLQEQDYDWSICLPNSFKSALIPYWARIPYRTGFRGELRSPLLNEVVRLDKRRMPRTVDRFVALGIPRRLPQPTQLPAPRLQVDTQARHATMAKFGLDQRLPVLAFAPGAEYGSAKRWPTRHWAELGRRAVAQGWQVWLLGSPKDSEICAEIAAHVPELQVLAGKTSLLEAVDLLSLAAVTVSNDSGLMHVAGAVGSQVIALYGSSPLALTPPLASTATALRLELPCSPCGKRECPLRHHRCMEDLLPNQVWASLPPAPRP